MTIDFDKLTPRALIDDPKLASEVLGLELEAKVNGNKELCAHLGSIVDAVVLYRGEGKLPPEPVSPEPGI